MFPRGRLKILSLNFCYRWVTNVDVGLHCCRCCFSPRKLCVEQMKLKKQLSGMSAHLYRNVIFSHVTEVIRKINLGKTWLKCRSFSDFDEFEVQTIPTGKIPILRVMREASSQNKGCPFKRTRFFPPSLLFLVLWRQEMRLDIKVWGGSDSLPLLCMELSTTPDITCEHTHTVCTQKYST